MIIKETLLDKIADVEVHPIGGRIYLPPPDICRQLYNGNSQDFYVAERRDLTPLVLGVMAMNLVTAKTLQLAYPKTLIDPVLWRPELINICKNLVFRTENGIEASLRTLEPSSFIYLRVSNYQSPDPTLQIFFSTNLDNSTRFGSLHSSR